MGGGRYGIWRRGRVSRGVYTLNPPNHKSGRYASYWNVFLFWFSSVFCKAENCFCFCGLNGLLV